MQLVKLIVKYGRLFLKGTISEVNMKNSKFVVWLCGNIVERWDWFIYRLACHSIRRMCERHGGFAYLFELSTREWRKEHPISLELETTTEQFLNNGTKQGDMAGWCNLEATLVLETSAAKACRFESCPGYLNNRNRSRSDYCCAFC
jgi:hypothetical protein